MIERLEVDNVSATSAAVNANNRNFLILRVGVSWKEISRTDMTESVAVFDQEQNRLAAPLSVRTKNKTLL